MPAHPSYDVVIVGGGIIGSSIACFLAAEPAFGGSVLVVERDPSYADCSTTRSLGSIRQQFSTPENIRMSAFGLHFVRNVADYLTLEHEDAAVAVPDLAFQPRGYLFLASADGVDILEQNHRIQKAEGAPVELLATDELMRRFPWLSTDGIRMASYGGSSEGWFDPAALLHGFRRKALELGVKYARDTVVGAGMERGCVSAVRLADAGRIACGALVNAAGARAAGVAAMVAARPLPVRPRKRNVFVFDCRERLGGFPLLIDPSGVYCRPESGRYVCGCAPPGDDPDTFDLDVDYDWFDEVIWPVLAKRVPVFEAIKLTGAWAGHYDMNLFDQNGIVGVHPDVPNFYLANGFSGHGVQQSPAVGRAIMELITFGAYRSLDLSALGFERIAAGRPVRELNIV